MPGWFTGYFGWWVACQLTRVLSPSWWVPGRGCPTWCLRGRGWCWAGCSSAPAGRRAPHCWWWGWVTTSGRRWRRLPRQATTAASGPGRGGWWCKAECSGWCSWWRTSSRTPGSAPSWSRCGWMEDLLSLSYYWQWRWAGPCPRSWCQSSRCTPGSDPAEVERRWQLLRSDQPAPPSPGALGSFCDVWGLSWSGIPWSREHRSEASLRCECTDACADEWILWTWKLYFYRENVLRNKKQQCKFLKNFFAILGELDHFYHHCSECKIREIGRIKVVKRRNGNFHNFFLLSYLFPHIVQGYRRSPQWTRRMWAFTSEFRVNSLRQTLQANLSSGKEDASNSGFSWCSWNLWAWSSWTIFTFWWYLNST